MSGGSWEAMTTAERLDRVALSGELMQLAIGFDGESLLLVMRDAEGAERCAQLARTLRRHAHALDDLSLTVDLARSRGLAEAATLILRSVEGARRFLRAAHAVDAYMTAAERRRQ